MPQPAAKGEAVDEEPAEPAYVAAPDDGSVEDRDRLRCLADGCDWTIEVSHEDCDASLSEALNHVRDRHGFGDKEWQQAAKLIRAERLAQLVADGVSAEFAEACADLVDLGVTVSTRFAPGRTSAEKLATPPDTSVTFRPADAAPLRELADALRGDR